MSQMELFDYNELAPEVQTEVKLASERIKMRMKRTAEDIIEIGKDLIAVKARLPHGQFLPWIQSEFEMSKDTAQNFIRVAERFGGKNGNFPFFKPSILYALAAPSTPDEVVEKAIEKAESGESVTVSEVKELKAQVIAAKKENEKLFRDFSLQAESALELEKRVQDLAMVVNSEREKLAKAEEEKQKAIAKALKGKEAEYNREMQQLQNELMAKIEAKEKAIEVEQKRLERFKSNPDPETKKKIEETHAALLRLQNDRRSAEARLNELRTQEDHARTNAIKFTRLKGAMEKVIADHSDGVLAISSPYMTESLLCDAEMLANALHDFAARIEQSIDASRHGDRQQTKTVQVEVL